MAFHGFSIYILEDFKYNNLDAFEDRLRAHLAVRIVSVSNKKSVASCNVACCFNEYRSHKQNVEMGLMFLII